MKSKGLIALDIDGTITEDLHAIPSEVVSYLAQLNSEGWDFIFITGRPYKWGFSSVKIMPFKYYLAIQNGAIILEMPEKKILFKQYLETTIFSVMDEICKNEPTDYVIYSGYEHSDLCFYRPAHFQSEMLKYLKERSNTLGEAYLALSTFGDLPISSFPSIKCFGLIESSQRIAVKMEAFLKLHVTPIQDPYDRRYWVVQATDPNVSKGYALKLMRKFYGREIFIISAGNDYNDVSMFECSDYNIVMNNSPYEILKWGDTIAPHVNKMGIIKGLQEAIRKNH